MIQKLRTRTGLIVDHPRVQQAIIVLIILNAVTLGMETSDTIMASASGILIALDRAILAIFVAEILMKLFARGPIGFFKNGWNIFDFCIVGIALMPATGALSALRAFRILRALRLLSVVPQMRKVIQALLSAIPGMLSIAALILLIFYVFAVICTKLFGDVFTDWFGSIGASMYTLFQIMTLESWSMGIVRPVMAEFPLAWMLFVPFILITSFAVLNLFIGIIVDSMQTMHDEAAAPTEAKKQKQREDELQAIREDLRDIKALLETRTSPPS